MSYDANNLSALTYANGFTLWHYKTEDQFHNINNTNYFQEACTMLRVGDVIILNCFKATQFIVVYKNNTNGCFVRKQD